MKEIRSLRVCVGERCVGRLAMTRDGLAAFEYDSEWIQYGFSLSPFSLPLEQRVFIPRRDNPFGGLFGIFADSLPDGWGKLLVDRMLVAKGINQRAVSVLQRLSIVGSSGMGALSYFPEISLSNDTALDKSLDELASACAEIFKSTSFSDDLDKLFQLGGSSGGARPKIFMHDDGKEWIVKFPSTTDAQDIGESEYAYSLCAKKCGIEMPETKLFPSKICGGYFGVQRFDINSGCGSVKRVHMASVAALLETNFRIPNLDYNDLMVLTLKLTKDYSEVEKLFRLMVFNVFAHNRDDHSKNFTFIYDEGSNRWLLSPAYDLTYSNSLGGEHATSINGNGKDPGTNDILAVAQNIGMDMKRAKAIMKEIRENTQELKRFIR